MATNFEESDYKAGFYYDLKILLVIIYLFFAIMLLYSIISSGHFPSTDFYIVISVSLGLWVFLDLQEFIEVKVSRHGWKCSKLNYKLSSAFLLLGVLTAPIANFLLNIERLPAIWSIATFFSSIIFLMVFPILGIAFAMTCYADFTEALKLSFFQKDKELTQVLSKHSVFYRKLSRNKNKS